MKLLITNPVRVMGSDLRFILEVYFIVKCN